MTRFHRLCEYLFGHEEPCAVSMNHPYERLVLLRTRRNRMLQEIAAIQQEVIAAEKEERLWRESLRESRKSHS